MKRTISTTRITDENGSLKKTVWVDSEEYKELEAKYNKAIEELKGDRKTDIITELQDQINKLKSEKWKMEVQEGMWKRYAEDLEIWHSRYFKPINAYSMDMGCSKPNKPGYFRANND